MTKLTGAGESASTRESSRRLAGLRENSDDVASVAGGVHADGVDGRERSSSSGTAAGRPVSTGGSGVASA